MVVQVTVIILFSTVSLPGFTQAQPGMLAVVDTMGASSFFHFFFGFLIMGGGRMCLIL